ncbi:MAG: sensor histidine kinase [Gallionellaceae bacterium]|nr:MAG: sensor histidine kinase [Gallionellaceae bacterium]
MQARLTLLMLSAVLLFGLSAGYESYKSALHEADEIFDAQLAQFAQSLAVLATAFDDEQAEPVPPPIHKYQQSLAFQVWVTEPSHHEQGAEHVPHILLRSNNATDMLPAKMPVEGFSSGKWQGTSWRYFRLRDTKHGIDVLVGQSDKARGDLAKEVAWHNIVPFLLGLPLLAAFAMLAIYFGLRPLRRLTESLRQLSPEQLTPIASHDAPKEIVPVVGALNSLLERIARTIENERRFTADASHELRTPLAALQAQIQAARLSNNKDEWMEGLAKAVQGADRMSHLVGQLLTLSRLDEAVSSPDAELLDLAGLVQECCAEIGAAALAKNIEIELDADVQPAISGSADMLRILFRNLLDNAVRYTPQGGRVRVVLRPASGGRAEIKIADSGTGVSDDNLALLGQRFNRLNQMGESGVGLGLSIVRRIAEIHRAEVVFSRAAELGGLNVTVTFPPQHTEKHT